MAHTTLPDGTIPIEVLTTPEPDKTVPPPVGSATEPISSWTRMARPRIALGSLIGSSKSPKGSPMSETTAEHARLMREMSDEILRIKPNAHVIYWHVLDHDGFKPMDPPQVYIAIMFDTDWNRIDEESLTAEDNLIVARYQELLGWNRREAGVEQIYLVEEAREYEHTEADYAKYPYIYDI